jgi:hypothetical protein
MFETSKDVLYLALALSAAGLAAFSCWAIFYFAMILKQLFEGVKEMRDRLRKVDKVINLAHDKLEHAASYLLLISEGIKKMVEVLKTRSDKKGD